MASSDRDWETWGADDPYYGVLTHAQFRKGAIDAHRDEFFASGTAFVTDLLARYQHHCGELPRGRALDFGCGVGRLTLAFAPHFAHVDGLDVSPSMLAEARQFMELAPLTVIGPAAAIVFASLTFIVLANGLRELLDVGSR